MRYKAFQQDTLRTGATSGGVFNRAQHQEVDSFVVNRVFPGNVGNFGIDLEHLPELAHFGPGALFDQLAFGGDGANLGTKGGW